MRYYIVDIKGTVYGDFGKKASLECIRNIIGCDATQYLLETGMIEIAGRYSETGAICCRIW